MITQPNSGEEKVTVQFERTYNTATRTQTTSAVIVCGHRYALDPGPLSVELKKLYIELSQLRAERDGLKIKVEKVQQAAFDIAEEGKTYKAEHDKLKEEIDKGKSAMKTMSELFSVTSQKCGTLESDNARLAAEVEKFKGMCVEATDKIYEQVQTISHLTAELEAAKGEAKEFSAKAIEFGNVAMTRGDQAIQFQAERDALAAKLSKILHDVKHNRTTETGGVE